MRVSWWLLPFFFFADSGLSSNGVFAQEKDGTGDQVQEGQSLQALGPQRTPAPQSRRYLIPYINSDKLSSGTHAATVVTVTNQSGTACDVSVSWFRGAPGGAICTSHFIDLPHNGTVDFCSRALPIAITQCNATCDSELIFDEGRAVLSSSTAPARCATLGASARVYYTAEGSDIEVRAITDSKVVRFREPNAGD